MATSGKATVVSERFALAQYSDQILVVGPVVAVAGHRSVEHLVYLVVLLAFTHYHVIHAVLGRGHVLSFVCAFDGVDQVHHELVVCCRQTVGLCPFHHESVDGIYLRLAAVHHILSHGSEPLGGPLAKSSHRACDLIVRKLMAFCPRHFNGFGDEFLCKGPVVLVLYHGSDVGL